MAIIKNRTALIKPCNIIMPRHGAGMPKDESGCILQYGHEGAHLFVTPTGRYVNWEFDFECKCGCNETDDYNDTCIIYC